MQHVGMKLSGNLRFSALSMSSTRETGAMYGWLSDTDNVQASRILCIATQLAPSTQARGTRGPKCARARLAARCARPVVTHLGKENFQKGGGAKAVRQQESDTCDNIWIATTSFDSPVAILMSRMWCTMAGPFIAPRSPILDKVATSRKTYLLVVCRLCS